MGALPSGACGVRILGTGSAVPERRLTNADFARMMDTSDEWIKQRTGISERRVLDLRTEGCSTLAQRALERALVAAGIKATELDFVIVATVTMEMTCPSVACRIAGAIGATNAAAFDLGAACSGFVYALNTAEAMIRAGRARTIAVLGAEAMSSIIATPTAQCRSCLATPLDAPSFRPFPTQPRAASISTWAPTAQAGTRSTFRAVKAMFPPRTPTTRSASALCA